MRKTQIHIRIHFSARHHSVFILCTFIITDDTQWDNNISINPMTVRNELAAGLGTNSITNKTTKS